MNQALCQAAINNAEIRRMLDDTIALLHARGIRPTRLNIIAAATDHGLDDEAAAEIADMIAAQLEQMGEAA
jgi:hypothetical protein